MSGIAISLAPDDGAFIASPTWEEISGTYNVRELAVDRGRQDEMSQTGTGTGTVELVDLTGDFDPTNSGGAFYGLGPMVQAKIELQNPSDDTWSTLFRGFISRILWQPYRREDHANVTLELVDGLALLAAAEMPPDGTYGNAVGNEGDIVFAEDSDHTNAVKTRIAHVLDQLGWPGTLRSIFTGNVGLLRSAYAPRSTALQVISDAAEAEFAGGVANVFIGGPKNPGYVVFHGRYARFHPEDVSYGIQTFQVGDDNAAAGDSDVVRISPPLTASIDDTTLYTSAFAIPQYDGTLTAATVGGQYVTDSTRADEIGLRTWSAENLLTANGRNLATDEDTTGLEETELMAEYVKDNFATPAIRVGQLTVKSRTLASLNGAATWAMLTEVDISDIVHLTTSHQGGGGFDTDFYVEGIHYQIRPGGTELVDAVTKPLPIVELTLDVSPKSFYDNVPPEWTT